MPKIFNASSPELAILAEYTSGEFVNRRLGLRVPAVPVTPENIGELSIVFEATLYYDVRREPYFRFSSERAGDSPVSVRVTPTCWILPLRNELHVWHAEEFAATFGGMREGKVDYDAMKAYMSEDVIQSAEALKQNLAWEEAEMTESRNDVETTTVGGGYRYNCGDRVRFLSNTNKELVGTVASHTVGVTGEEYRGYVVNHPDGGAIVMAESALRPYQYRVDDVVQLKDGGNLAKVVRTHLQDLELEFKGGATAWFPDTAVTLYSTDARQYHEVSPDLNPRPEGWDEKAHPVYNFELGDEVLVTDTQERGTVTVVEVEDATDGFRRKVEVEMHTTTVRVLHAPEDLVKIEPVVQPKFKVDEKAVYRHGDFTETVEVEGYEPQDDGSIRYKVRWPNGAVSHELEAVLLRIQDN